mgnify:CR=1 FL=1
MPTKKRKIDDVGRDRVVSYGILLYKESSVETQVVSSPTKESVSAASHSPSFQFLLGLIPQRNWWTVFKGMPEIEKNESPVDTALREFEEETGSRGLLTQTNFAPITTLHGRVGKHKEIHIYLHEGSIFDEKESFDLDKVVKIDSGYMAGKPEIVAVKWMTLDEALQGCDHDDGGRKSRIYKSQESILRDAYDFLNKTGSVTAKGKSSENQSRRTDEL